jgi:hypothetical protein
MGKKEDRLNASLPESSSSPHKFVQNLSKIPLSELRPELIDEE